MNEQHLVVCGSEEWAEHIASAVVPWALERVPTVGKLLEIGPGPGAATEVLRHRTDSLTAVEYDPTLAAKLTDRFADDATVTVLHGDGTALTQADASFDTVASFTMLHHVPTIEAQDRLFAEAARVLRPGGVFVGVDSLGGPAFEAFHVDDICVPLNPFTLRERLEGVGFADVEVSVTAPGVRWVAFVADAGGRVSVSDPFLELYRSDDFVGLMADHGVPSLLDATPLGDDPLHLVAGPGAGAAALRPHAPRLTLAQLDGRLVDELTATWSADDAVEVVGVGPTHLPFDDNRFSAATVLLSLLHLRASATQDRALAELARVLRPGARLVGLNAIDGDHFRSLNDDGRAIPIDPMTFGDRLARAGFDDVQIDLWSFPRFSARAPKS